MTGTFPSLIVSADRLIPNGVFAQAQADFLEPDPESVARMDELLLSRNAGAVAHFYMGAELQGVLTASSTDRVSISDSLLMADAAVKMADDGVGTVVVLGVDFMSENVRAMLDASGHTETQVLRVASEEIGCSLAASAESRAYEAYLRKAAQTPNSLHVIYVNTSLRTKARAQALLPTITCTSSNVVRTVLQSAAQVPGLHVWFGPDTYMGQNLESLLRGLASLGDDAIRQQHPAHDTASVRALCDRFHYFQQGTCIVHHMFGSEVAKKVESEYADAFVTAHLEVPGEMFALALQAQQRGRGVVGSTSNILGFITDRVGEAAAGGEARRLRFVLGTESGMITSIVRRVQEKLREAPVGTEAEIVFPVAEEAITPTTDAALPIVPGPAAGEGCSTEGGCATCPYMKMNSLDAFLDVLERADHPSALVAFQPRKYAEKIQGQTAAELGGATILHMRAFQRTGQLSDELVHDVRTRHSA